MELIEEEIAKLTPEGKDIWEDVELLIESSQPSDEVKAQLFGILQKAAEMSREEEAIYKALYELKIYGLFAADLEESRGKNGDAMRDKAVVLAAWEKERAKGRTVDPHMALDQALALLGRQD